MVKPIRSPPYCYLLAVLGKQKVKENDLFCQIALFMLYDDQRMIVGLYETNEKTKQCYFSFFYRVYEDRLVVLPSSEIAHFNVLYLIVNSSLAKTSDIRLSKIKPFQGKLSVFSILKWDAEPFLLLLNQINEYD